MKKTLKLTTLIIALFVFALPLSAEDIKSIGELDHCGSLNASQVDKSGSCSGEKTEYMASEKESSNTLLSREKNGCESNCEDEKVLEKNQENNCSEKAVKKYENSSKGENKSTNIRSNNKSCKGNC